MDEKKNGMDPKIYIAENCCVVSTSTITLPTCTD